MIVKTIFKTITVNPASYLTIHFNASDNYATDANNNASVRLKNAKEALASIENKLELTNHYVTRSFKLISFSNDHLKFEEEVIQRCLERFKSLDTSLKNYSKREKETENDYGNEEINKFQKGLQGHQNLRAQDLSHYMDIDINNKHEVLFWCKKFNAARPDIIEAIEKLNTKGWVELWKYFLKKADTSRSKDQFILLKS